MKEVKTIDDMIVDTKKPEFMALVVLQKKYDAALKEIEALKKNSLPAVNEEAFEGMSNEAIVCYTQLAILKRYAQERELSFEESRKFQIFTTVLQELRAQSNVDDMSGGSLRVDAMSEEDLIKIAASEG